MINEPTIKMNSPQMGSRPSPASFSRRLNPRVQSVVPGFLSVPAENSRLVCSVLNICARGAGIACLNPPPRHTYAILEIPSLGKFESTVAWFSRGALGLRFVADISETELVKAMLARLLVLGRTPFKGTQSPPVPSSSITTPAVVWYDGHELRLKTSDCKPLNSPIRFGQFNGMVVAHLPDGIIVKREHSGVAL